jgi:hypothetical protein
MPIHPKDPSAQSIGKVHQNKSGVTLFVVVTASRNGPHFSIFGNVAQESDHLPTNGNNDATVVQASFIDAGHASNITFIVPPNWFYNVTVDGEGITLHYWLEATN